MKKLKHKSSENTETKKSLKTENIQVEVVYSKNNKKIEDCLYEILKLKIL